MRDLKNIANEYAKGVEKMTEEVKKQFGAVVLEDTFEPEHLELIQNMFGMIELSNRLVVAQAEMIQEINEKLDKLSVTR